MGILAQWRSSDRKERGQNSRDRGRDHDVRVELLCAECWVVGYCRFWFRFSRTITGVSILENGNTELHFYGMATHWFLCFVL